MRKYKATVKKSFGFNSELEIVSLEEFFFFFFFIQEKFYFIFFKIVYIDRRVIWKGFLRSISVKQESRPIMMSGNVWIRGSNILYIYIFDQIVLFEISSIHLFFHHQLTKLFPNEQKIIYTRLIFFRSNTFYWQKK